MDTELTQLRLNEEEEILQLQIDPGSDGEDEEFQVVGCFLTARVIHFPAMRSTMANLWHPIYGVQIQDLGTKRYLFQFFHSMDMESLKGPTMDFQ